MREPPANLTLDAIRACLAADYGRAVRAVTFLPLGHDASAWAYRADTPGDGPFFVKVRLGIPNEAGLLVPRYLYAHGVAQAVAPLPTRTGAFWTSCGGYALMLYPLVAGEAGMQRGLTDLQWIDYGAQLRRIHDRPVPSTLARSMIRESFRPNGADLVRGLDAQIGAGTRDEYDHPARQLVTCWLAHRATIRRLLARAEALGRQVGQAAPPLVLCHADIHTGNVMAGDDGRVWFVDWDETMLAPRERDLMFVVGGGISRALVSLQHEALFMQGYRRDAGPVRIDSLALAYYRYAWAVSDIGEFGDEVLSRPDLGPSDRTGGATLFCGLFAPGNIVEMALASDAGPAAP